MRKIVRKIVRRILIMGMFFLLVVVLAPGFSSKAASFNLIETVSAKSVPEGKLVRTSLGRRYYYSDGTYMKNRWAKINGYIYHFNKEGYADKGWITVRGRKYFLRATGRLVTDGFLTIKGQKYYFKPGYGYRLNGWQTIEDEQYYFRRTGTVGTMVKNKWVNGRYLGTDGKMCKNTWIGDKYVGEDGKVTTPPEPAIQEPKCIFVGDSRTVGLYQIITGDTLRNRDATQSVLDQLKNDRTDIYIGKCSMGYDWLMGEGIEELRIVLRQYPTSSVVLRMGVNDMGNIENYISLYRNLMIEFPSARFYMESVTPVNKKLAVASGYSVTNTQIKNFNSFLQSAFPTQYLDSYRYLLNNNGKTVDGIHYTPDTYRKIYTFLDASVLITSEKS